MDHGAGLLDRPAQHAGQRARVGRGRGERAGRGRAGGAHRPLDGLDGEPRGRAPARMPAHAIRDDVQEELVVDEQRVLVVVAAPADIGQAAGGHGQRSRMTHADGA